ncbi:ArsR/SmtB family transcription factor [Amycolatopsis azurea]|uniref:HTH arsR-type domain-containing protein n=1 Tax=Amycolatopsis azurea DSM 43854 TaxID=1238180 RepID=M2PPM5_9PSEU|nr:helix-turn-helix domain-containing protein [Amycolatopsis azurea]EMD26508.1 hypothetical protein C791_3352 [Amycolatopsis azurea DSM 43854]
MDGGLGRTGFLSVLSTPHTTSALAASTGTSIGNASRHATVLREAGLISGDRQGSAVLHHL